MDLFLREAADRIGADDVLRKMDASKNRAFSVVI